MDERNEGVVRLAKPLKKGILRLIFSRFLLIGILLAVQIGILVLAYVYFTEKLPVLLHIQWILCFGMIIYLFNISMDTSAKLTWMLFIGVLPIAGTAMFCWTKGHFCQSTMKCSENTRTRRSLRTASL